MDHQKIIDKICKCLRLAESCNPNEAASALRQAQRLMQKYQIAEHQIRSAYVSEQSLETDLAKSPPFWALALVNLVADAFDCRGFVDRHYGTFSEFRFIGVGSAAEVATYSFSVLLRMLSEARQAFLDDLQESDLLEQQRRADVFAQAWLFRVGRTVRDFVGNADLRQRVDEYIDKKYGEIVENEALAEPSACEPENRDYEDILCGLRAANEARLLRPVTFQAAAEQLEVIL